MECDDPTWTATVGCLGYLSFFFSAWRRILPWQRRPPRPSAASGSRRGSIRATRRRREPFTYRTILTAQFPRSSSARISSTSPPLRSQRCSLRAPGARAGWRLARSCARSRCFLPERCSPRASPSATVNGAPLRRRRPCAFLCAFSRRWRRHFRTSANSSQISPRASRRSP